MDGSHYGFHSYLLSLGGRTAQQISEQWPEKCSCAEVQSSEETLRASEENRHLGEVSAGKSL